MPSAHPTQRNRQFHTRRTHLTLSPCPRRAPPALTRTLTTAAVTAPRPSLDAALLAVAVAGVSLSAPLAAATAAPALAIAFWRNAMAVGALTPLALWRHRGELRRMGRRAVALSAASGALLAVHFGTWLPSLHMTSVASSTALVTTTPIWTALLLRLRGHRPSPAAALGTVLAFLVW